MRILIVDDEPVSRSLLVKMMRDIAQCEAVDNGAEAIAAHKQALADACPFDLMTLDISMPTMDGREVLDQIRQTEKDMGVQKDRQIKIIMVSRHKDRETITACIKSGCDGFISKPFNKQIVVNKLAELGFAVPQTRVPVETGDQGKGSAAAVDAEGSEILQEKKIAEIVERFERGEIDLPVLPKVIQDVQKVMNDPASTADDLAEVIVRDAVISIKLIAVANSPMYRGSQQIRSVQKAIPRLGFNETQSIVSAIANKSLYDAKNRHIQAVMEKLWFHSLASAYAARAIAKKLGHADSERLFFMGLVHDIGKPLIIKRLEEMADKKAPLNIDDEMPAIDRIHTSFGQMLLGRWGFTKDLAKIPLLHDSQHFSEDTEQDILIVSLANHLSRKIGYSLHDDDVDLAELEPTKLLGISPEDLDLICEEVKATIQKSVDTF